MFIGLGAPITRLSKSGIAAALSPLAGNVTENAAAGTVIISAAAFNWPVSAIANVNPTGWMALSGGSLVVGATNPDADFSDTATADLTYNRGAGPEVIAVTITVTNIAAPASPSAPSVSALSSTSLQITLPADPALDGAVLTGREGRRSTDGASWTTFSIASSPHTLPGLLASTTYHVQWRVNTNEGDSGWSPTGFGTTSSGAGVAPEQMDAPGLFPASTTAMDVWRPSPPRSINAVDGYDLQYSTASDFTGATTVADVDEYTQVTGLTANTRYYFRYVAKSGGASTNGRPHSDWTLPSTVLTAADVPALQAHLTSLTTAGGAIIDLVSGTFNNPAFTSGMDFAAPVIIRSQTRPGTHTTIADRTGGATISGGTMNGCTNIKFINIKFYQAQADPAVNQNSTNALNMTGVNSRIGFRRCEFAGSTIEKSPRGNAWSRILVQGDANDNKNITFVENWMHDASRAVIMALDATTTDNENFFAFNYGIDCYQFALQFGGGSNLTACFNYFQNFFSVDVGFDTAIDGALTATTANSVTLPNVASVNAVPLDGYRYMMLEAFSGPNLGESVQISGYDNTTRVASFTGSFTNVPSTADQYKLRDPSQAHQSAMPMTPNGGVNQSNINWFGNVYGGSQYREFFCQIAGMKLDDKGTASEQYRNCWLHGNLNVASQSISLEISNGDADSGIYRNTLVYDLNWIRRNTPATRLSGGGLDNLATVEHNVSSGLLPTGVDVGVGVQAGIGSKYTARKNIRANRADTTPSPTLDAMFVGPSFNGVYSDPIGIFQPLVGGAPANTGIFGALGCGATAGYVTWPAGFKDFPAPGSINGSLPRRRSTISLTDQIDVALGSVITHAAVQINDVSDGTQVFFGSDTSGGTAEVRILASDGTTVIVDWDTPVWADGVSTIEIDPGQYVQVRLTSAATISTARTVELRVGSAGDTWSVTTIATDVTAPVLTSGFVTIRSHATALAGVTTDDATGPLSWVITTSATQPSNAQIEAGQDHTGASVGAGRSGSFTPAAPGAQVWQATGMSASTNYWLHVTQKDASNNFATRVTASFTTPATNAEVWYLGEIIQPMSGVTSKTVDLSSLLLLDDDVIVATYGATSNTDRTIGVQTSGYGEIGELFSNDTNDAQLSVSCGRVPTVPGNTITFEFTSSGFSTSPGRLSIRAYRGVSASQVFDQTGVNGVATSGINGKAVNPGSITPTGPANSMIVIAGVGSGPDTHTAAYSSSDLEDFTSGPITTNSTFSALLGVGNQLWASGAFGAAAWTGMDSDTSCSWAAIALALHKA